MLAPRARRPPTSTVISGAVSDSRLARSSRPLLRRELVAGLEVVAEAVALRLEHRERLHVGLLLRGVGATRAERHGDVVPGVLGGLLDGGAATEDDQVGERHRLAEVALDPLELRQHAAEPARLVDGPVLLRGQADAGAVGAAALVGVAVGRRRCPRGEDEVGDRQARVEDRLLERRDVGVADQLVVDRRHRVLPELRLGHPGAEEARDRDPCRGGAACTRPGRTRRRTGRGCRGTAPRSCGTRDR